MTQPAIDIRGLSKFYKYYDRERDRVKEILTGRPLYRKSVALQEINLQVHHGEVLGIVGKNGAGKSTLLKILARTMQPSEGEVQVNGRVAALLELGGNFHPEMSGHDNIYLNCAIKGLKKPEIDAIYDDIVEFSGIRDFIHRPVKTYSSGMFMRLAFSVATHVDPDILIIDEALSVGDGVFARKSFDRIMEFKEADKTILFCSHSLYQVEAICDRVMWIEKGRVRALGEPAAVVTEYGAALRNESPRQETPQVAPERQPAAEPEAAAGSAAAAEQEGGPGPAPAAEQKEAPAGAPDAEDEEPAGVAPHILDVRLSADGTVGRSLHLHSGKSDLEIEVTFHPGKNLPMPCVAIAFTGGDGRILSSAATLNDGLVPRLTEDGRGHALIRFPAFPLLKGRYNVNIYLLCEKGVHIYEAVVQAGELNVQQQSLIQGLVELPHEWQT